MCLIVSAEADYLIWGVSSRSAGMHGLNVLKIAGVDRLGYRIFKWFANCYGGINQIQHFASNLVESRSHRIFRACLACFALGRHHIWSRTKDLAWQPIAPALIAHLGRCCRRKLG